VVGGGTHAKKTPPQEPTYFFGGRPEPPTEPERDIKGEDLV
jgi:hypothetical protein